MRRLKYLAAAVAVTGLLTGPAVTAASASASQGAGAQAAAGVHLLATWPGSQPVLSGKSGPAVRFAFPVTGGRVTLSPLGGKVHHGGGILFVNAKNGKKIEVSRFTIDLTRDGLTGIVNGNPTARVPLFRLDLSHARLAAGRHLVTARGIGLKLTSAAAKALNAALGTRLFSAGLDLGTATTLLRF
jgi:hypothetical protein